MCGSMYLSACQRISTYDPPVIHVIREYTVYMEAEDPHWSPLPSVPSWTVSGVV